MSLLSQDDQAWQKQVTIAAEALCLALESKPNVTVGGMAPDQREVMAARIWLLLSLAGVKRPE